MFGLIVIVSTALADNPWVVWPTLVAAVIAATGVIGGVLSFMLRKWNLFEVTYIEPSADMSRKTPSFYALAIEPGLSMFKLSVKANKGLVLTGISPAAFHGPSCPAALMPRQHGDELDRKLFVIENMTQRIGGVDTDSWKEMTPEHSTAGKLWRLADRELAGGRRQIFKCHITVDNGLDNTDGLLSFEVLFRIGGDPGGRRMRLPFQIASSGKHPKRWWLKKIRRRGCLTLKAHDSGNSDSRPEST